MGIPSPALSSPLSCRLPSPITRGLPPPCPPPLHNQAMKGWTQCEANMKWHQRSTINGEPLKK